MEAPSWGDQEEMGARDPGPESCVCSSSEAGGELRKEVCLQPPRAVRKQSPSSGDLLPGPLGPPQGGSGPELMEQIDSSLAPVLSLSRGCQGLG